MVEEVEVPQDYTSMTLAELREIAKEKGIEGYAKLKKAELIEVLGWFLVPFFIGEYYVR